MKRVLIAGSGSYIGTHLLDELSRYSDRYDAQELDVRKPWPANAFCGFDVVVIVAGLAHKKETKENRLDYQRVNCDLAVQIAEEAKKAGVHQLIYLSSMSVYGLNEGRITKNTHPDPKTAYGQSKWNGEQQLSLLVDDTFTVAVLRPPMVYGRNCPGNYGKLAALAVKVPIFPYFYNERSMIYVETLCNWIRQIIEEQTGGLFFPQNSAYVQTIELMKQIAKCHGRTLRTVKGFDWCVVLLRRLFPAARKAFGTLTYEKEMSESFLWNEQISFEESICKSEGVP